MCAAVSLEVADIAVADAVDFQRVSGASDAAVADLERYRLLLIDWNARMNLVGASTLDTFWSRHAWDSAQLLQLAPVALTWADHVISASLTPMLHESLTLASAGTEALRQ